MTAAGGDAGKVIQAVTYSGCSAARLYAATVRWVSETGFVVNARDDARTALGFRSATPTGSWPYEQMTAAAHADGSGVRGVLAGAPVGGSWMQMGQWREGHAVAMMVLDHLKTVLPQVPGPAA